jgi:hypothetical protein
MTYPEELFTEVWHSTNDVEMCWRIRTSGLPLDEDDTRLVARLYDQVDTRASVYDLYRLNMLCHQAVGWVRARKAHP